MMMFMAVWFLEGSEASEVKKASSSFLKKRTKKLLLLGSGGRLNIPCKRYKSFLRRRPVRAFFSKKRPLAPALLGVFTALSLAALLGCATPQPPAPPAPPAVAVYPTSFVCQDGNTPVQNAVCGDPQLAALDVQLAAIYRQHLGSDDMFERDQMLASQRAWLLTLQTSCDLPAAVTNADGSSAPPASAGSIACLAAAEQARFATLTNWPALPHADTQSAAIAKYLDVKPLDSHQPALCAALLAAIPGSLGDDGALDPNKLPGAQEVAGSHGRRSAGNIAVDLYRAPLYAGYARRARGVSIGGQTVLGADALGSYVEHSSNGGGRFTTYASQTGDYGDIDVLTLAGQTVALVSDAIGYNTPAPPGEAAAAGVFILGQGTAPAPACLFQTYINPPPLSLGVFSEQPSLTPFLALLDSIAGQPPAQLAGSDRQDTVYLNQQTRWEVLNMPLVALAQVKDGAWTGWLRNRHDQVLDTLYAWSQQSPANQAEFSRLFALLQPAAQDLDTIYVQQQGVKVNDAAQATAVAMMELLYQATINMAPGLGAGPADPADFAAYAPRYPVLANPSP
jgi:uncharacterized protein YecT (DUF1311 family)